MNTEFKQSIKSIKNQISKLGYQNSGATSSRASEPLSENSKYSSKRSIRPTPPNRPPPPALSTPTIIRNPASRPKLNDPLPNGNRSPTSPTSHISSTNGYKPKPSTPTKPNLPPKPSRPQKNPSFDNVMQELRESMSFVSNKFQTITTSSKKQGQVYSAPAFTATSIHSTPSVTPHSPFQIVSSRDNCLECRDFTAVDAHAAKFPRQSNPSIQNLAFALCSPFQSRTERARAIFIWLHHNVAYDSMAFFNNTVRSKTPEETLRTGLAVCQGYAELFAILARQGGLEAVVVSGHGKGVGYRETVDGLVPMFKSNHAWNAVKFDSGHWHLIDPCWGAGYLDNNNCYQKHLGTKHFTSSAETFRVRHFPTNVQDQFCSTSMAWEEYIMMREGPFLYLSFEDMGFSEVTLQPFTKAIRPEPTRFILTTKCRHLSIHPRDQHVLLLEVDGVFTNFDVDSFGTTWTCQSWSIRKGSQVSVNFVDTFGEKMAKGVSIEEYLRTKDRVGMSWTKLCKWDVSF